MLSIIQIERIHQLHQMGLEQSLISERMGIPEGSINWALKKKVLATKSFISPEEAQKIRELNEGGMSPTKIACIVGRSITGVKSLLQREGRTATPKPKIGSVRHLKKPERSEDNCVLIEGDAWRDVKMRLGEALRYNEKHKCYELRKQGVWYTTNFREMAKIANVELGGQM